MPSSTESAPSASYARRLHRMLGLYVLGVLGFVALMASVHRDEHVAFFIDTLVRVAVVELH